MIIFAYYCSNNSFFFVGYDYFDKLKTLIYQGFSVGLDSVFHFVKEL